MSWSEKKRAIFDASVRLFSEKGYNIVTVREIAAAVDLNPSAIYFQFKDKEDILNEIFEAFERELKRYLITKDQVDRYIETDTPRRLLERFLKAFKLGESEFISCAYRITCMEMMTNTRARELVIGLLHMETAQSIRYALDSLIRRGKIPAFDTRLYSTLWAQSMFSGAVTWLNDFHKGEKAQITSTKYQELGEGLIDIALNGRIPDNSS